MMHSNSFVATIKVNGKFVREQGAVLRIPFGIEYSIFLKNLNSRRALASISIDGKDIAGGTRFILSPNSVFEVERFLRNGNMNEGNKFKFIERTSAVEKHRGVQPEDGLIRVEFWKEQEVIRVPRIEYYPVPIPDRRRNWDRRIGFQSFLKSSNTTAGITGATVNCSNSMLDSRSASASCFNETGITAEGSYSNQSFYYGESFATETQSTVIVLHLKGEVEGKQITRVVSTKQKETCSSCGLKSSSANAFCPRCGTSLQLVG